MEYITGMDIVVDSLLDQILGFISRQLSHPGEHIQIIQNTNHRYIK